MARTRIDEGLRKLVAGLVKVDSRHMLFGSFEVNVHGLAVSSVNHSLAAVEIVAVDGGNFLLFGGLGRLGSYGL